MSDIFPLCHTRRGHIWTWIQLNLSYRTRLLQVQVQVQVHPWGLCWSSEWMRRGSCWPRELAALRRIPPSWAPSSPGDYLYRAPTWTWGRGRSCAKTQTWPPSGLRGADLLSCRMRWCWTSAGWAASGEDALCFALCPRGRPSLLLLVPGEQMSSTCICPMAAQELGRGQTSAKASYNGASGTRDPELDLPSPQGGFCCYSWSSKHRPPSGSSNEQMEASKTAKTAGLPTAVLHRGHTNPNKSLVIGASSSRQVGFVFMLTATVLFLNRLVTVFLRGSCCQMKSKFLRNPTNQVSSTSKSSRLWFPLLETETVHTV